MTSTYLTERCTVPVCSNCTESFSQWKKRKSLRNKLFLISLIALIFVSFVSFIITYIIPLMDPFIMESPFTSESLTFGNTFPVIILIIVTIALGVATIALNSSESNPSNYIKFGQYRVLVTPLNSTRLWSLEAWNRIITEEQMEAERLYIFANHLNDEGNYVEAIKFYDKALDLFPEYTEVIHDRNITITELSRKI